MSRFFLIRPPMAPQQYCYVNSLPDHFFSSASYEVLPRLPVGKTVGKGTVPHSFPTLVLKYLLSWTLGSFLHLSYLSWGQKRGFDVETEHFIDISMCMSCHAYMCKKKKSKWEKGSLFTGILSQWHVLYPKIVALKCASSCTRGLCVCHKLY